MTEGEHDAAEVIAAYRRRRERMVPLLLGGTAVVLLVVGLFLVVIWLTGDSPPRIGFLATDTPTATITPTPPPPTETPTPSATPTITETPTPSGPRTYIVQEGDTLFSIAEQFEIDLDVLLAANPDVEQRGGTVLLGEEITIPPPGSELPTPTSLPETLSPGTRIEYVVRSGDTLGSIAEQFNSTAEAIADLNDIENPNDIRIGDRLIVPVNIVTPAPTPTPGTPTPGSPTPTATP